MATFSNAWDETIPLDNLLSGLSEAGKIDDLIRQMKLDIRERILKFAPVGMVIKWSSSVIPYGFKECNGASLLKSMYPALYTVLGDYHGSADSLHFNIPNMLGRYPRGWNHGKTSGLYDADAATRTATTKDGHTMSAGDHVGSEQEDENESHSHTYYWGYSGFGSISVDNSTSNSNPSTAQTESTGSEMRPKSIYQKYIIRIDDPNPLDGAYSYRREWDEDIPINSNYYGRMAMEIRKLREDVEALVNNFFPPGMVIYWPGSVAPDGYLEMNGQSYDPVTYPELYDVLQDLYGENLLPDCRGLFIRADDGSSISEILDSDVKAHEHSMNGYVFTPWYFAMGIGAQSIIPVGFPSVIKQAATTSNKPARTVDGHPKNMYLMACIRARACA